MTVSYQNSQPADLAFPLCAFFSQNMRALLLLLICAKSILAEITILSNPSVIYDRSPKLRIKGAGFDAEDHEIRLDISAQGVESLRVEKDYSITKDGQSEGLVLKLLSGRKWVELDERTPPVALILKGVFFSNDPQKNLLPEQKIVAQVLATPAIEEDTSVKYMSTSGALTLKGSGFTGAKKVDLYFSPPLLKGIAYEIGTQLPTTQDYIQLRLRSGFKWRETAGNLRLIGIDTGGGPVKVNDDEGVIVAKIAEDLDSSKVAVLETSSTQKIYHDEAQITITGSGFNPDGTYLRFSNGLMGAGVNYTTARITETEMTLKLVQGSYWRKNVENLPGFLTLLAVNNGDGWIATGPINSGKGKDVAAVFERPEVFSSNVEIYRRHSHEFHIRGRGFVRVLGKVQLQFSPPLTEGLDYSLRIVDRADLEVTLTDGRAWRENPGPLIVTAISSHGDNGWVKLADGQGTHVADVVSDVSVAKTGGIEIFPMGTRVYQSILRQSITVLGSGFTNEMRITFDPPLKANIDYSMTVRSTNKLVLALLPGRKWAKTPSFIIAKSVTIDGESYELAGSDGIRVAVVLADPVITPGTANIHQGQSKVVTIMGSGFTNVADTKITIRPTVPGAYQVLGVTDKLVRVQLLPNKEWLPNFLSLSDDSDDKKIPLEITSIDTGAGVIDFDFPYVVGNVVKDREGVVCDDSCEFAFDGICDDGTETDYYEYYEEYGYYQDDDEGGYYYVGDDKEGDDDDEGGDDDKSQDDDEGEDDDDGEDDDKTKVRRGRKPPAGKKNIMPVRKSKKPSSKADDDADDEADDEGEDDDDAGDDDESDDDVADDDEVGHKEGYYSYSYDDYYAEDDAYTVSACLEGTDCTDCGGVDAIVDYSKAPAAGSKVESCTNTCPYARDGICDDPRGANYCTLGTDCQDCGPVGHDNFTRADDDGWWDDDDDYWSFNDGTFLEQTKGLNANRHRIKHMNVDSAGPAAMFLIVLEGMVYAVGGIFALIGIYLALRVYQGESLPFLKAFNADDAMNDLEMERLTTRKMAITPDVIRT
jgi:hypothetical protein